MPKKKKKSKTKKNLQKKEGGKLKKDLQEKNV